MYTVLIVDDEQFAVEGITQGVPWNSLGVSRVLWANDAEQAKTRLADSPPVHAVVCDIEMPGQNGLELMAWVKDRYPGIEAIFLTCHADFKYAQQAVHLGSLDYLLKPVDYGLLAQTVGKALDKVRESEQAAAAGRQLQKYYSLWEKKKNVVYERFWQDLFWQRTLPARESVEYALAASGMPISPHTRVLPVLISVERWGKPLQAREEEALEFALRNVAEEILLTGDPSSGQVLEDDNGIQFALLFHEPGLPEGTPAPAPPNADALKRRCQAYIAACETYLYCSVSCYIGEWSSLTEVSRAYNALLLMEHNNVTRGQAVLFYRDQPAAERRSAPLPHLFEWAGLMEPAKREQLDALSAETFDRMERDANTTSATLNAFFHAVLQTVFHVLHKKGVPVRDVFPDLGALEAAAAGKTVRDLRDWTNRTISAVMAHLSVMGKQESVVDKVKRQIGDRLFHDISREELAELAHLNPAYLSRLFRKETGVSLTDYIIREKMGQARELLLHTNETVTEIAQRFRYANFSHFSKLFRKYYGLNPQEYRRRHGSRDQG